MSIPQNSLKINPRKVILVHEKVYLASKLKYRTEVEKKAIRFLVVTRKKDLYLADILVYPRGEANYE